MLNLLVLIRKDEFNTACSNWTLLGKWSGDEDAADEFRKYISIDDQNWNAWKNDTFKLAVSYLAYKKLKVMLDPELIPNHQFLFKVLDARYG